MRTAFPTSTASSFGDRVFSLAASEDSVAVGLGFDDGRLLLLDIDFNIRAGVFLGDHDVYQVAFHGENDALVLCMVDGCGLLVFDRNLQLVCRSITSCDEFALRSPPSQAIAVATSVGPAVHLFDKRLAPLTSNLLCKDLVSTRKFGSCVSVAWRANKLAMLLMPQSNEWTAVEGIVVVALDDEFAVAASHGRQIAEKRTGAINPQWYKDFILYFTLDGVYFVDGDLRCVRRVVLPVSIGFHGHVVRAVVHEQKGWLACQVRLYHDDHDGADTHHDKNQLLILESPFEHAEPVAGEPRFKRAREEAHSTKSPTSTTIDSPFMPYLWKGSRLIGTKSAYSSAAQIALPRFLWGALRQHVLRCRPAALWWQEYTARKQCDAGGKGRMTDLESFRENFVDRARSLALWDALRKNVLLCRPAAQWWVEYTANRASINPVTL